MKAYLRKQCLKNRDNLDKDLRDKYSFMICQKALPFLQDKKHIMSYMPIKSEVDTSFLNDYFMDMIYPVILNNNEMEARIDKELIDNKYGIKEPKNGILINPDEIDAIIIPIVCFDAIKNRIGYGKGYYDRFLIKTNALKIGFAFECQKVDKIIKEDNDIILDLIITEKTIY